MLEGNEDKAPLAKISLSGSTFMNEAEAFLYIETSFLSFLDVSNSSLKRFSFLSQMKALEHLNVSSSTMGDDTVEMVACIGANLRNLNLSDTRVSSAGVGILAGHLPNLEILSLSGTSIDDYAISYISTMPSLKVIDLSNTEIKGTNPSKQLFEFINFRFLILISGKSLMFYNVPDSHIFLITQFKMYSVLDITLCLYYLYFQLYSCLTCASGLAGFIQQVGAETDFVLSLTALQSLSHLERLNLEQTQVRDATICPLSTFKELSHLSLRSASLTDLSLDHLSSLSKLTSLCVRDAVLTNSGLGSFKPPATLKLLDLHGGWLLTEDAILQFCKMHPQIEVMHELIIISPSDQIGSNRPSPSKICLRASLVNKKQDQIPISEYFLGGDACTVIFYKMQFRVFI